ncbi:glycosyltransferase [Staphylococcus hyicus]
MPFYKGKEKIKENITKLTTILAETAKLKSFKYDELFVDDGSTDDTIENLQNADETMQQVKYIWFSRNF